MNQSPLEQHAKLWTEFFAQVPPADLPPLSEVHRFLGRGADAVGLSATPAEQRQALVAAGSLRDWTTSKPASVSPAAEEPLTRSARCRGGPVSCSSLPGTTPARSLGPGGSATRRDK